MACSENDAAIHMSSEIEVMYGENGCNGIQSYVRILRKRQWVALILIEALKPFLGHTESIESPRLNTLPLRKRHRLSPVNRKLAYSLTFLCNSLIFSINAKKGNFNNDIFININIM